jgi:hypothetical protein
MLKGAGDWIRQEGHDATMWNNIKRHRNRRCDQLLLEEEALLVGTSAAAPATPAPEAAAGLTQEVVRALLPGGSPKLTGGPSSVDTLLVGTSAAAPTTAAPEAAAGLTQEVVRALPPGGSLKPAGGPVVTTADGDMV